MNTNVKNISEIVDDIKETLTDHQYKTIMDKLMALNNNKIEDYNAHMMNLYDRGLIFNKMGNSNLH